MGTHWHPDTNPSRDSPLTSKMKLCSILVLSFLLFLLLLLLSVTEAQVETCSLKGSCDAYNVCEATRSYLYCASSLDNPSEDYTQTCLSVMSQCINLRSDCGLTDCSSYGATGGGSSMASQSPTQLSCQQQCQAQCGEAPVSDYQCVGDNVQCSCGVQNIPTSTPSDVGNVFSRIPIYLLVLAGAIFLVAIVVSLCKKKTSEPSNYSSLA